MVDSNPGDGDFDVRVVADVNGDPTDVPFAGSTRWLRVRDQDASAAQNRFYSNTLAHDGLGYEMELFVYPIEVPGVAAQNKPRLAVQHGRMAGGVATTWGIELDAAGAALVVLADGGVPARVSLGQLGAAWTRVSLRADFAAGTVSAQVENGAVASLPIAPAADVDLGSTRFCYRGEGIDNQAILMLDAIGFDFQFCQQDLGSAGPGSARASLCGFGLAAGGASTFAIENAPANALGGLLVSAPGAADVPVLGGNLVSFGGFLFNLPIQADGNGALSVEIDGSATVFQAVLQAVFVDFSTPNGLGFTNAIMARAGE